MRSPVHANFGLAESTETSIKCKSHLSQGKRFVFIQGECEEEMIEEAFLLQDMLLNHHEFAIEGQNMK